MQGRTASTTGPGWARRSSGARACPSAWWCTRNTWAQHSRCAPHCSQCALGSCTWESAVSSPGAAGMGCAEVTQAGAAAGVGLGGGIILTGAKRGGRRRAVECAVLHHSPGRGVFIVELRCTRVLGWRAATILQKANLARNDQLCSTTKQNRAHRKQKWKATATRSTATGPSYHYNYVHDTLLQRK